MTDMEFMKILYAASTITCCLSVIGMLSIYGKLMQRLSLLAIAVHHIIIHKGRVEYGSGVQGVAENTKVAE